MVDFKTDIRRGSICEDIFRIDYLEHLEIKYKNMTGHYKYRSNGIDFYTDQGLYEVKTYNDRGYIVIEEYQNKNVELGPLKKGWFHTTQCDILVFVSAYSRQMILLPFHQRFKYNYECWKESGVVTEVLNDISQNGYAKWQSSYCRVPLDLLGDYITIYHKTEN